MRSNMKNLYYDVVIAGCGVAGLYAALNLPEEMNILMLSKKDLEKGGKSVNRNLNTNQVLNLNPDQSLNWNWN